MQHIEEVAYNALSFVWNVNEEAKVSVWQRRAWVTQESPGGDLGLWQLLPQGARGHPQGGGRRVAEKRRLYSQKGQALSSSVTLDQSFCCNRGALVAPAERVTWGSHDKVKGTAQSAA